jgi:hypothetical protein
MFLEMGSLMRLRIIPILLFLVFAAGQSAAQEPIVMRGIILDGDTVPEMSTRDFFIFEPIVFKSVRAQKQYNRLVFNVKKVYPYAKLAGAMFKQYEDTLMKISSSKEQKLMMKKAEDEIMAKFGDELKKLNITQGVILIKLIDRETGQCSYDILRDFRGRLIAGLWQTVGRIFGYNLREKYEPSGRDSNIEYIVKQIEAGVL